MASTITTTNVVGKSANAASVEKYLNEAWQDLPMKSFDTPLVNSRLGIPATIPRHKGQYVQFRIFSDFTPNYNMYGQKEEPDSGETVTSSTVSVALKELVGRADMGNLEAMTDIVDIVPKVKELLLRKIRKEVHMQVTYAFVNAISDVGLYEDDSTTFASSPFSTLYAGGAENFASLDADSYVTMADFQDAVSRMQNDDVPPAYGDGTFCACIDYATLWQLCAGDAEFAKVWREHRDMVRATQQTVSLPKYANLTWVLQSSGVAYRCDLPGAGGALATTALASGAVHVSHVIGGNSLSGAFAYVDLAGKRRLRPTWKVQDITVTGCKSTIGYRIPFRCAVIRSGYGLNIAGTSQFSNGVAD